MALTTAESEIVKKQLVIEKLQAKLAKKLEVNRSDVTADEEILYAKQLELAKILEV